MKKLHIPNKLTQLLLPFVFQPPPKIPDKQLDEREHTIEEWKGNSHQILRDEAERASGILCCFIHHVGETKDILYYS